MTYRDMLKMLLRTPEDRLDDEVVVVDSWQGNVFTGVTMEVSKTSKVEPDEGGKHVLYRKGTRIIVLPG